MAAVIAWLETIPAVDQQMPERKIGPVLGLLTGLGQIKPAPRMIEHDAVVTFFNEVLETAQKKDWLSGNTSASTAR